VSEPDYHHEWARQRRHEQDSPSRIHYERDLLLGRVKGVIHCIDIGAVTTLDEAKEMLQRLLSETQKGTI